MKPPPLVVGQLLYQVRRYAKHGNYVRVVKVGRKWATLAGADG